MGVTMGDLIRELHDENNRLRAALQHARRQLVTLGGEAKNYPENERDTIQATILETIDAALYPAT